MTLQRNRKEKYYAYACLSVCMSAHRVDATKFFFSLTFKRCVINTTKLKLEKKVRKMNALICLFFL